MLKHIGLLVLAWLSLAWVVPVAAQTPEVVPSRPVSSTSCASADRNVVANDDSGAVAAARAAAGELRRGAEAHRLILLGELHGTRQPPAIVRQLATQFASVGPVLVGLEILDSEQPAIDRYLASDGGPRARKQLLAGEFWQKPVASSDGRRNADMIGLIDSLRRLRHEGRDVAVLAFDGVLDGSGGSQARDVAMAGRIRAAFGRFPRGRMLALAGNVHAMHHKPGYAPPEMQDPMGSYLADLHPFAVNITAHDGEFQACMEGTCGPRPMHDQRIASGPRDGDPYDYELVLDRFTLAQLLNPLLRCELSQ